LNLPHEHVVYEYVVVPHGQLVLDAYQPDLVLHLLIFIQLLQYIHDVNEALLTALQLGSHQVTHLKSNQINSDGEFIKIDMPCLDEMMNQYAQVLLRILNGDSVDLC
jgi:hypothetical protein